MFKKIIFLSLIGFLITAAAGCDLFQKPTVQTPASQQQQTNPPAAGKKPTFIYAETIKTETADNRGWPTDILWQKTEDGEAKILVNAIGKVGEMAISYKLAPDGKNMLVNLESKLASVDLAAGTVKDLFFPKKQVNNYVFSQDGKRLLIWDQIYASDDTEYYVHEFDLENNADKILQHGFAEKGHYFFINYWRENDGIVVLAQAMGEISIPWHMNLNSGSLKKTISDSVIWMHEGYPYLLAFKDTIQDICNEMSGSDPSTYDVLDPVTGTKLGELGEKGKAAFLVNVSPDKKETLYKTYQPFTDSALCSTAKEPEMSYFKIAAEGTGSPTPVADHQILLDNWYPHEAHYDPKIEEQNTILYKGSRTILTLPSKYRFVLEYYQ